MTPNWSWLPEVPQNESIWLQRGPDNSTEFKIDHDDKKISQSNLRKIQNPENEP